jgi:hypothetical protein
MKLEFDFVEPLDVEVSLVTMYGRTYIDDMRVLFRGVDVSTTLKPCEIRKIEQTVISNYEERQQEGNE